MCVDQRLEQGDPAAAARDDQAQLRVDRSRGLEQRLDLGLELGALGRQGDRRRRALEPVQVLGEGERARPP